MIMNILKIELGEVPLINFMTGNSLSEIYYLPKKDDSFKIIETDDKFISKHVVKFKEYEFEKIMHFLK